MGKKKEIPEFAVDETGNLKRVVSKSFTIKLQISDWHRHSNRLSKRNYRESNKQFIQLNKKAYYQQNITKQKLRANNFYMQNKQRCIKQNVLARKIRRKDLTYRRHQNFRNNIGHIFTAGDKQKWGKELFRDTLKCTKDEFDDYIQSKFRDGMSWDNHGHKGWHYDHIIPSSAALNASCFDVDCDYESYYLRLNHHTNFRPSWAKDNLSKGDSRSEELTKLSDERYNQWRIKQSDKNWDFQI